MNNLSLNSLQELDSILKNKNFKKIFILCGKKSFKLSGANKILEKKLINKDTYFYFKNSPYPEIIELKKIINSIQKFSPDLIIAVGGGSVIDYAKIANVLNNNENLKKTIINSTYKIKNKFSKLLAIPTTSGSGAEVTSNAVIYIGKKKYSIESEIIKPDYFILLPKLVINSSVKIKSSAGFDAIAQAIESLISRKSNQASVKYAKRSLEISLKNYLNFLKTPSLSNTSAMCIAANLSGKAISISKTTAPHAVSYPFTSFFNISHGHAVSLTLNKFLKFNYFNYKSSNCDFNLLQRYKIIFDLFMVKDINELDQKMLIIQKKAKLENNLVKLGIDMNKNYSKIISGVNLLRLKNNPIELKKEDLKIILKN